MKGPRSKSPAAAPAQQQLTLEFDQDVATASTEAASAQTAAPGSVQSINELLDRGCIVLTASRQLAHALRIEYAQHAQRRGLKAWPTPQLLPWSAWLHSQWIERRSHERGERLLSRAQARVLWQQVIGHSDLAAQLLDVDSAAQTAALS